MSQVPFIYNTTLSKSRVDYLTELNKLPTTGKLVLDFTAKWCGPCQKISPEYEKLSSLDEFKDILFYKVDVDKSEELCEKFKIQCMPTFILLKDGEEVDRLTGANMEKLYQLLISNHFAFQSLQLQENNKQNETIQGSITNIF